VSIKTLLVSLTCVAVSLPLGAATIPYNSVDNTYFLGVEDRGIGGAISGTSDYDYNDLIFSLTGTSTVTLEGDGGSGLFPPVPTVTPTNTPPAFWNNPSYDSNPSNNLFNFGQCLYMNGNGCGGTALQPTAAYLAETAGQTSSNFYFAGGGTITLDLLANITNDTTDVTSLMYCVEGTTTCSPITFTAGVATFTPGGNFDLVLNNNGNFYDSNTAVAGVTDPGFDHFAVALGTPEPGTLAVVGTFLVGLGVLRRRRNQER